MIQMLEWADKDLKAAIITILSEVEENKLIINENIGKLNRKIEINRNSRK